MLGRQQGCARAAEGIENDPSGLRTVADRIGHHDERLDGCMGPQFLVAIAVETVIPLIGPDISAIASVLAQTKVVDVPAFSILTHEDQFML